MNQKRLVSLLTSLALAVSLALPVSAASSFSDVKDGTTAVNADVLRLMGVVDGVGGGSFHPGGTLTRAQFCTMVVNFLQRGSEVPLHTTRTIFADVTPRHWALGYVNLAASIQIADGESSIPLISGVGNGKFEPDSTITLAQAATILIRVLGYSSQQAGAVWPNSYMNLASSIGLTQSITVQSGDPLTRAQAAQLFVNALNCKTGDGTVYYQTLGTPVENTVLLAVNVATDDGTAHGAVRTSGGTYLPRNEGAAPTGLQGQRGALVLNDRQEIVTFVPDDSESVTFTLAGSALPTSLKGSDGRQYVISSATPVYTADKAEGESYVSAYTKLTSGVQVTLFTQRGKVVAIYMGGGTTADSEAVIVTSSPSPADFHTITGGAQGWTIQKSRQNITLSQLKPYDVVTYDPMSNTLVASDLRLNCIYEDASPSAKAPETIKVLGYDFPVLPSAWDTIQTFELGDQVSLLLTADGKVAGMASASLRSTAVGTVSSGSASLFLPLGGTIPLTGEIRGDEAENQLALLSSSYRGRITANKIGGTSPSGSFDPTAMTMGSYPVAAGVRLYEKAGSSMTEISLSALDGKTVPAGGVAGFHLNSSGYVDYLILNPVTGDSYTYGKLVKSSQSGSSGGLDYSNVTVAVENGSAGLSAHIAGISFQDGAFGGVASGIGNLDGTPKAAGILTLKQIKGVSPGDFFVHEGASYVNAGGRNYLVSDHVECYKSVNRSWFTGDTGEARLAACKAYSNELTVYLDPIGEKVRIVTAD